jgi:hypothetical protein
MGGAGVSVYSMVVLVDATRRCPPAPTGFDKTAAKPALRVRY